ncbi:serine protease [Agrobacterium tumefaciens]|uniref:serine protease n=1 Tax=Agrobacterium tumefaciens TaxID=358 RepID=UPI000DD09978|nr:serine protease [Agrobacterium tumefaciens]
MKVAVILALLCATPAYAEVKWEGFKDVNGNPQIVDQKLADSVVRVFSVGSVHKSTDKPVKTVDVSKVRKFSAEDLDASTEDLFAKNLENIQIESCRKQDLRKCPIMSVYTSFSGHFDKGRILKTCRHPFHNWLIWASKANNRKIGTFSPPMAITDRHAKAVYNSAVVSFEDMLQFTMINTSAKLNFILGDRIEDLSKADKNAYLSTDYAELESRNALMPSITQDYDADVGDLDLDEDIYLIGYSGKTEMFSNQSSNAVGGKLVATSGRIKINFEKENSVGASNVTFGGMSGGVLVHSWGTIIGTSCGWVNYKGKEKLAVSMFNDHAAINEMWSKLP